MRLGVVSDTHGHAENALRAVRMLESLEVQCVLHCGDVGSADIPRLFAAWPTHFVAGNCDPDFDELKAAITGRHQWHGLFGDIELAGRKIALLHSHDGRKFRQTIASGKYDLVCYGHTHVPESHLEGRTLVLNPGALYRAHPHTIAIVDLESLEVTIIPV